MKNTTEILKFQYMGGRNYIDIAQIVDLFLKAKVAEFISSQLQDLEVRIQKPILTHCFLAEQKVNFTDADPGKVFATISCKINGLKRSWCLLETTTLINDHIPDPYSFNDERIQIDGDRCMIGEAICDAPIKLYMLMGKALICHFNKDVNPRVAAVLMDRLPQTHELATLNVKMQPTIRNGFFILELFIQNDFIGITIVHK